MSFIDRFLNRGEKEEVQESPIGKSGLEIAISETSNFYTSGDFPKYNPDELIGRKGFGIYEKMAKDDQIKAALKFKRDAITARGYTFQLDPEESGLSEEEARRRIRICENIIDQIHGSFNDAIHKILSAMKTGFSITEIVGDDVEIDGLTYKGIRYLKLKPADTFKFNVDEYGNVIDIEQQVLSDTNHLDYDKFVHFVVNPDIDEHYGESELRTCYRAWFSKDIAIKLRNIYMERHAGGFHVLTPPPNKQLTPGTAEYNSLVAMIKNINTKTGVILPSSDYTLRGEYPSNSTDIFERTIDQSDLQISRALLLPNLLGITPTGQTGSYSQSETQLDAFFWTLGNDSDRLAEVINDQLFKHLGYANFADGIYPKFKWNPMSKTKAIELIKLFTELVSKRVLKNTPEDEDFIRSALELPAVDAYVSEEDEPQDEEDIGEEQEDEEEGGEDASEESAEGEQRDADDELEDEDEEDLSRKSNKRKKDYEHPDETILGAATISVGMKKAAEFAKVAFSSTLSRINFAAIDNKSEAIIDKHMTKVSVITDTIAVEVVEAAKQGGSVDNEVKENLDLVKVPTKHKTKLKNAVAGLLRESEKFGRVEAAKEIDKAMGQAFSMRMDYSRVDFIAEDYFEASSFRITGNLTDEMTKYIEAEILNGARYDKTWEQVEQAIYARLATKGLISVALAKDKLAEDLDVKTPDARLRTIVRTSTFDAINNARDAYFTDPQLGDFVRAYEYSAILDSVTSDICRHLDEDNAGDHTVEWYRSNSGFRPPNHFNCRSLLVAVTANDLQEFEEGPEPSIQPNEGFS